MPQLQPGQVVPGQGQAPKLYGTEKPQNNVPFQEKLMQLFKPQEFVTIKNVTDEPLYWQYMPADNETENFSEDGMQRMITREAPEMWYIPAGEVEVVIGASAYRALDVMYKAYMANSTLRKYRDPSSQMYDEKGQHLPRNFNYADGGAQDNFIEIAYLGKATPTFGVQPVAAAPQPAFANPEPLNTSNPTPTHVDPTVPVPKTTDGAPLVEPTYAQPDADVTETAAKKAKELTNAGGNKK